MIYIQENCELNLIWDILYFIFLNIEARNSNFINKYIEQRDIENRALDPSIDQWYQFLKV